jgi:hypothetical protein
LNVQEVSCATSPIFINLVGMGNWSNQACGPMTPGQENLFSFTPATTGAYSLQITSASGDFIDYMRKAASGGCTSDGWTCIGRTNTTATLPIGTLTAGETHLILGDGETTGSAIQTFRVECPANDTCSNVVPLSCGTPVTKSASGAGYWNLTTCLGAETTLGQEKLFSFTPSTTGTYTLEVTSSSGSSTNYFYRSAACSPDGWICIDEIAAPVPPRLGRCWRASRTTFWRIL